MNCDCDCNCNCLMQLKPCELGARLCKGRKKKKEERKRGRKKERKNLGLICLFLVNINHSTSNIPQPLHLQLQLPSPSISISITVPILPLVPGLSLFPTPYSLQLHDARERAFLQLQLEDAKRRKEGPQQTRFHSIKSIDHQRQIVFLATQLSNTYLPTYLPTTNSTYQIRPSIHSLTRPLDHSPTRPPAHSNLAFLRSSTLHTPPAIT